METKHLVVIGGSDAGISAALRARELDPSWRVTVVVADRYPNFSICGIPFYVGGEVLEHDHLAHRSHSDLEAAGLGLKLDTRAVGLDVAAQRVHLEGAPAVPYDSLVVGTGAVSRLPDVPGIDLPGVYPLRWIHEARRVRDALRDGVERIALVGGGYVNLELAEALAHRSLEVHLFERNVEPLKTVDPGLGARIRERLEAAGVIVHTKAGVRGIAEAERRLRVQADGAEAVVDRVIVSTGAVPAADLLAEAGVALGAGGALVVDDRMATSIDRVWAAGDCVHTLNRITGGYGYQPLGTTAHKQGRVAGANAIGGAARYRGTCGTQIVRVLGLVAARTGLDDRESEAAGFHPRTLQIETWDHKAYMPGAEPLVIRITGDAGSGRLLGVQMLGAVQTQAAKRIDVAASALFSGLGVAELGDLDLSYTPPLGAPWDPLQEAAHAWLAAG